MLQQVLLPMRSNSRARTHCTRRPYTIRHGPHGGACSRLIHMCMHAVLPPSLSHWGTHAVLSLVLGTHVVIPLSRMQMQLGSLSHWGHAHYVPLSLATGRVHAHALSGRRNSRRRRGAQQQQQQKEEAHVQKNKHAEARSASDAAACAEVRTRGSVRTSVCYHIVLKVRRDVRRVCILCSAHAKEKDEHSSSSKRG
jgi:hypothetical protein